MLAKLLKRLNPSEDERIVRAKTRLIQKYPGDRDSIWRIVGAPHASLFYTGQCKECRGISRHMKTCTIACGKELATFGGCYRDALQWAFSAPGFFENGMSGDITQLLPNFKGDHNVHDGEKPFTQRAMRIPQIG
jgi:hypothetical protein